LPNNDKSDSNDKNSNDQFTKHSFIAAPLGLTWVSNRQTIGFSSFQLTQFPCREIQKRKYVILIKIKKIA